jgi:hypothetical protein
MAGIQAAVLSVIFVVVPAVAAFTATSAAEVNNGVSWLDTARAAADLWLLGHWGSVVLGTGSDSALVTVSPLGVALATILCCRFLGRVSAARGWWLVGFGTLGFAAVSAVVAFAVTTSAARPSAPIGLVGSAVPAIAGFLWGNATGGRRRSRNALLVPQMGEWARSAVPPWLRAVPRGAVFAVSATVGSAVALTLVWVAFGYGRFGEMTAALDAGLVGGVALFLLSVAFAPNIVAYAVAYLAGTGFSIGSGTLFSPAETIPGVLPALPILGILPDSSPAGAAWLVAVPVAVGGFTGLWLRRRLPASTSWWTMTASALLCSLAAAGGLALLVAVASGAGGPGRMAEVGAAPGTVFAVLAVELVGGCVTVALAARAQVANRLYDAFHARKPIEVTGRTGATRSRVQSAVPIDPEVNPV